MTNRERQINLLRAMPTKKARLNQGGLYDDISYSVDRVMTVTARIFDKQLLPIYLVFGRILGAKCSNVI